MSRMRPGRLERRDSTGRTRAGQVVERGERRAVGQPGRGLDDIRQAARAAMRDSRRSPAASRPSWAPTAATSASDRGVTTSSRPGRPSPTARCTRAGSGAFVSAVGTGAVCECRSEDDVGRLSGSDEVQTLTGLRLDVLRVVPLLLLLLQERHPLLGGPRLLTQRRDLAALVDVGTRRPGQRQRERREDDEQHGRPARQPCGRTASIGTPGQSARPWAGPRPAWPSDSLPGRTYAQAHVRAHPGDRLDAADHSPEQGCLGQPWNRGKADRPA